MGYAYYWIDIVSHFNIHSRDSILSITTWYNTIVIPDAWHTIQLTYLIFLTHVMT
jgi:hypothetical protein